MKRFELNIYGADDEILKTYSASRVKMGVFERAVILADELPKLNSSEIFEAFHELFKDIYPGLTDEDYSFADYDDILNTFSAIVSLSKN
ncbi:MAG: hypothetical protein FWG90_03700 [Oscillospiraceae bacterium]|nr:hypothetical protein [Oscillospiraceae bacterium]